MATATPYDLEQEADAMRERLVAALINEALDVLHHDRTDGSEVDQYERRQLRTRFEACLHAYR